MSLSSSPSHTSTPMSSSSGSLPGTPPNLHQNSIDPAARWLVQKYGGTSVGKFVTKIAEDIVPAYLDQHKVAIVCSARSGSTKALGTTNLLLRAALEALQRSTASVPGPSGTSTPLMRSTVFGRGPSAVSSSPPSPYRKDSVSSPFTPNGNGSIFQSASFNTTVDTLRIEHLTAARSSIRDPALLKELEDELERDIEGLRGFLFAAQIIDEISPRSRDSIVGVGERMACKIVASILRDRGIDAEFVSLEDILPSSTADSESPSLNEAGTLEQSFYDDLAERVGNRIREVAPRVPVVTGFFGPVPGSLLRQVGRGYTDLLSALLAVGLQASELQIWKEVDGVFTADPRKVPTARLIPVISPEEAAELTYYGSEVVHHFSMEQVIRKKIPIRIKNVENPSGGGTVIHPDPDDLPSPLPVSPLLSTPTSSSGLASLQELSLFTAEDLLVQAETRRKKLPTAVTSKEHIIVVNVHSNRKNVSHGFLAGIFGTLDRFGVVVDLISTSEVLVSMAIEDTLGKSALTKLVRELEKHGTVSVSHDMAILSLVGKQMRNMVGIAGRMFSTLADGNINLEMISQGASEINISCVINARDAAKALNLIHQSCLLIKPEGPRGRVGPWLF